MKQLRRGLLTTMAALLFAVLCVPIVGAQSAPSQVANGFRISPVRSELSIEKGKSDTLTITVENPTDIPTTAKAVVNDFVASSEETGSPQLILDDTKAAPRNSFKSLVGNINSVPLGPKEKKDVVVKLTVPADARAGGYYGAVRFVPGSEAQPGQGTNVGLTASVGTIVLVTVPGDLVQKVDLVQLSASQNGKAKSFLTGGDVTILTRLKNVGDIHVKPFGRLEVKDGFGKVISSYEFNDVEPRANILPDSIRRFETSMGHKKLFGRYTIQASIGYEQGSGDLIIAKATFWYIPAWVLYALLGFLLVIALLSFWFVRRSQGKKAILKVRLRRKKK
jgi:hypothetical protein